MLQTRARPAIGIVNRMRTMAESTIPVDVLNPGQVFACLGLVEAADILIGDACGVFDWGGAQCQFRVAARGTEAPVARVLNFLDKAQVTVRVPAGSSNIQKWNPSWGCAPNVAPSGCPFPFPDPDSPATLPAILREQEDEIEISHWGDAATGRDNVKFWAGAGGYPGAALLRDACDLASGRIAQHASDPFALSAEHTSSFRFDWRRDYVPVDAGFSPNKHGKSMSMIGFPLVEVLAAIGVTHARPQRSNKLEYRYGVLGGSDPLDLVLLRAGLGGHSPLPGAPFRRFAMRLDWPAKEGQARCITHVKEEDSCD